MCGQGEDGQLGLGQNVLSCTKPTLLEALRDKFITQMAVGVSQTAAVTAESELLMWGTSCFEVHFAPHYVEGLRGKRVEQIALGVHHAAALVREADESMQWEGRKRGAERNKLGMG
jgi:hypothetical protein